MGSDSGLLSELVSSSEYSDSEVVFWGLDSWSNVWGDESILGVQQFARRGKLVLLLCFDFKSRHQTLQVTRVCLDLGLGQGDACWSYTN